MRVSNLGPLLLESDALPTELLGSPPSERKDVGWTYTMALHRTLMGYIEGERTLSPIFKSKAAE